MRLHVSVAIAVQKSTSISLHVDDMLVFLLYVIFFKP